MLRRLLRRAARFGRELGFREPFMARLVDVLVESMGQTFPELPGFLLRQTVVAAPAAMEWDVPQYIDAT